MSAHLGGEADMQGVSDRAVCYSVSSSPCWREAHRVFILSTQLSLTAPDMEPGRGFGPLLKCVASLRCQYHCMQLSNRVATVHLMKHLMRVSRLLIRLSGQRKEGARDSPP